MKAFPPLRGCLLAGGVLLSAVTASRATVVPFEQLPAPIQKSVKAQALGATLGAIDLQEEDGVVTYHVDLTKAGHPSAITLSATGVLETLELTLQESPPAVQKTIQGLVGAGALETIEKDLTENAARYDADWKSHDGLEHSATIRENGTLESVTMSLAESPPAVQAAIAKEAGGTSVEEIRKTFEDGVSYEVTVTRGDRERDFSVGENGRLNSHQVFLEETPAVVQAAVQHALGKGMLQRIDQVFERKKGVFEVESLLDGKPYNFSIGPKGKFLGVDATDGGN